MHYTTLKTKAWSHRGVLAVSLMIAVAATAIAAVPKTNEQAFAARVTATATAGNVQYNVTIVENGTGRTVESKGIQGRPNEDVTFVSGEQTSAGELEFRVIARADAKGEGNARLEVRRDGRMVQNSVHTIVHEFTGEPITLSLNGADLKDVMQTFSEITGLQMKIAPGVEGKVSINVRDMPWDEAMMLIAKMTGTKITVEGKTIHITK